MLQDHTPKLISYRRGICCTASVCLAHARIREWNKLGAVRIDWENLFSSWWLLSVGKSSTLTANIVFIELICRISSGIPEMLHSNRSCHNLYRQQQLKKQNQMLKNLYPWFRSNNLTVFFPTSSTAWRVSTEQDKALSADDFIGIHCWPWIT